MNFVELQRETHYLLRDTNFLTNNSDQYVNDYIKNWINEGERQFCLFTDYSLEDAFNISTIQSTREYTLPSDFIREVSIIYNKNVLSKSSYSKALLYAIEGIPYSYYLRRNLIGFIPTPDSAYNIICVYLSSGGNMINDTDEPIIPEVYHDVLIHYACMKASLQGDDVRYRQFRELWVEKMQIAKQHLFYRANLNSIDFAGDNKTKISSNYGDIDEYIIGI